MHRIKLYYSLTKPGVLYGNVLTTVAGFLFASIHGFDGWLFVATVLGTSLVIGAACVINNYLDQDIDQVMERTKKRAIVSGEVRARDALIFGVVLGILGMIVLVLFTNLLVALIGLVGFVVYVWLYGALSKRRSIHGTLVGSISGAMPILAGYVAVTGNIDIAAILLFCILFLWQMPEFYSISVYRHDEYKKANVPVISVVKGIRHTKIQIFAYTVAFVIATLLLSTTGYASVTYLVVMLVLGLVWIYRGLLGLRMSAADSAKWARKMFSFSLIILLAFSALISVDKWLP